MRLAMQIKPASAKSLATSPAVRLIHKLVWFTNTMRNPFLNSDFHKPNSNDNMQLYALTDSAYILHSILCLETEIFVQTVTKVIPIKNVR